MSSTAHTARMIAKLLANRATARDEIPDLIAQVHRTLSNIDRPRGRPETVKGEVAAKVKAAALPKRRGRKPRELAAPVAVPAVKVTPVTPPAPTLLRRAEIKETVEVAPAPIPSLDGIARGVVRWFDPQTRRGGLRLQGVGGDVAVEPQLLAQCNITRLFKGQEVEARLAGTPEAPKLLEVKLRAATANAHVSPGLVRARQQKPVVVELKREAPKSHSARDAAEQLLPGRSR